MIQPLNSWPKLPLTIKVQRKAIGFCSAISRAGAARSGRYGRALSSIRFEAAARRDGNASALDQAEQ